MLSASESLRIFLGNQRNGRNQDLLDRVLAHGTDLELQVNVSPKGGELVDGTISTFSDGIDRWHSFRIPKDSYSDPYWKDFTLRYPLDKHVDAIGSTGWLWAKRQSLWVAFDFDSVTGHAEGVGISDQELLRVKQAVQQLDYVEVRRSTGGSGLHLYVFLPPGIQTANHHEHAAVARCILSRISEDVGFDLQASVDACGANTWVWARRANDDNQGFSLLKKATCDFPHDLNNWRDHIAVISRSRPRVSIGIPDREEDIFNQLACAHRRVPLDETHTAIRDRLASMGCAIWVQDHGLLQTHTALLKRIMEEGMIEVKGVFETSSPGSNTNQPNCFMFPMDDGAWRVFRFGAGTSEHKSWTQDGKGWTTCYYNRRPTLDAAAAAGGAKVLAKGGFEFGMLRDAARVISEDMANDPTLEINVPEKLATRRAVVRKTANGQVVIEVPKVSDDPDMPAWNSSDKKGYWSQVVNTQAEPNGDISGDYDNILRCLETPNSQPAGWAVTKENGAWTRKAPGSVKTILQSFGHAKPDAEVVMGVSERRPWELVTVPFAPEYPGDRRWNLGAPQLAIQPAAPNDEQESQHPHWDSMLDHIGQPLNLKLREMPWAIESGILTGRQYLQAWYANVLRNPFSPLPYLFLYGVENTGKSIFHEAFSILVTGGVIKADQALTSAFNGELEGCIIAVVEEKDVAKAQGAHEKIKDAVTSPMLSIRRMRTDAYQVRNTTHWVQCSNRIEACPVFSGDSRITVICVPELDKEIPKERFKSMLEAEAPFFLRTLLSMPLPAPTSRLRLPIVVTDAKIAIISSNRSAVELFIDEHCEMGKEFEMDFTDFWAGVNTLGVEVSRQKVSRDLVMVRGVALRSGTSNKRIIKGLRLKVKQ